MPKLIAAPTRISAAGNKPKQIEEFIGLVNSGDGALSIARMKSPPGWGEPGQQPDFQEISVVLSGSLRLVRNAGVLRSFVRGPGSAEWTQVFGSLTPGVDTVYGLGLTARGDQYSGGAATVAYDGFRVSSGTFRCPSWWRDAGPDWAAAH